jgi:CheY-like chemotaxis protein
MSPINQRLILMAEDDADDRLLVKDALSECGLAENLRFVEDGEDLMDYLLGRGKHAGAEAAPKPGLILMDLNMPRKDGREVLREIRAHPDLRRIPVIAFTTSKADADVGTLYDLGVNSFICKPVAFEALVNVMTTLSRYWFGIVELPGDQAKAV